MTNEVSMVNNAFWFTTPELGYVWYYLLNGESVCRLERHDYGYVFSAFIRSSRRCVLTSKDLKSAQSEALAVYKRLLKMQIDDDLQSANKYQHVLDLINGQQIIKGDAII